MTTNEKRLIKGNYAIAQAALNAGCECYFGYPITPQTEIGEYLSEEMYKFKRPYVCAESELAAINMVLGAVSTGVKAMTSSSSCAVALMQEALSYACSDELPVVLVNVMRAGPGLGYIYPAQGDYNQSVYGGGNGDYKLTVLAPSTVQECIDLTYKAFYYAQKYRNPTMILADGLLGQMMEPASFGKYPYPEVDVSSWALTGAKGREGRKICSVAPSEDMQLRHIDNLFKKYQLMKKEITEWEEFETEDADVILVAFGSLTRNVKATMKALREEGLKVGVFRPVTLSPFPDKRLEELAETCKKFVVVEMNMGQMVRDVKIAVNGKASVDLINRSVGQWLSVEEITAGVKEKVLEKTYASI
ncbi:MAG: 3-methyl-2-oxobutanoate dehydrogenase subunit VorB [Candidatus Gastranaerophilales bacterium]|nr:3-methyl-2-oxobutanoate dehydrogenase subunit VorB [Candidatus Gastranaerophilales bacterium]